MRREKVDRSRERISATQRQLGGWWSVVPLLLPRGKLHLSVASGRLLANVLEDSDPPCSIRFGSNGTRPTPNVREAQLFELTNGRWISKPTREGAAQLVLLTRCPLGRWLV